MPRTKPGGGRELDRWVAAAQTGGRLAATALTAFAATTTKDPQRALRKAYSKQMATYRKGKAAVQARAIAGTAAAGAGATGAAVAAASAQPPIAIAMAAASAGIGVWAAKSWRRLRGYPDPPTPPPEPLPALSPTDPGSDAIARLGRAEISLAEMVPAAARVHPGAAAELRAAAEAATPALHDLAHRLSILNRLRRTSGEPAASADAAAHTVAARLAEGVNAYERLIAAAASLLAAPDPGRSVADVVEPAVEGLTAYTLGLQHADSVLRDPS